MGQPSRRRPIYADSPRARLTATILERCRSRSPKVSAPDCDDLGSMAGAPNSSCVALPCTSTLRRRILWHHITRRMPCGRR